MKATDLPELRDELVRFLRSPLGQQVYSESNKRAGWFGGGPLTKDSLDSVRRFEASAVALGEMYYVNADMTVLAEAAGQTLPGFTLLREDFPADQGLCVFDHPIAAISPRADLNPFDSETFIIAFSWNFYRLDELNDRVHACLSYYAWTPANLSNAVKLGNLDEENAAFMARVNPRLTHENEGFFLLGQHFEFDEMERSVLTTYGRTALATILLMQQPGVAAVADHEYTKLDRARLKRRRQEPQRVRVIQLRRPPQRSTGEHGDRQYDHRWAVRGHWRKQWYPSRDDHQPIWIAPHIKGPEGAPLKTGEKVYAWVR